MNQSAHPAHLSLARFWQGDELWLCAEAQITVRSGSETKRLKGFIHLEPAKGKASVRWLTQKPDAVKTGGASTLLRSRIPTSSVEGIATAVPTGESETSECMVLALVHKDKDGNIRRSYLNLSLSRSRSIELVMWDHTKKVATSQFRWNDKGFYTVRKAALEWNFLFEHQESETGYGKDLLPELLSFALGDSDKGSTEDFNETLAPDQSLGIATLPLFQRQARDRVARRLKTLHKTLKQDSTKVPTESHLEHLRRESHFLRLYLHLVKPEEVHLRLSPEQTGLPEDLIISLDPDRSAGDQLNERFHQTKRQEKALELGVKRIRQLEQSIMKLENVLTKLRGTIPLNHSDVEHLLEQAGLASRQVSSPQQRERQSQKTAAQGRIFLASTGATLLVGRSAEENDRLTKSAKSNDWWVHTSGSQQGAHVIVQRRTYKNAAPDQELDQATLKEAAILAIHFSTLSLSKQGEVYVTTRGELRKRKGMPAGLWLVGRSKTQMVRYEDAELAALFAREVRTAGALRSTQGELAT